ncbi:MAG: hypothetical protein EXX96DRAFT_544179 [Benjaminiella poitrasii]|nr:MAG: hypothetical protein EXX96DRAFT_544179 [Benjaminiella poitrasii]
MRFIPYKRLLLSIILFAISPLIHAQNCKPSNCSASCTPGCSINDVCTLGTMVVCGVCPDSKCISRTVLGLPPVSSNNPTSAISDNGNNSTSSLVGGLVGGLLGGGLILGVMAYFFIYRRRNNKNRLPLAFHSMKKEEKTNRNISGVIPVTFIPPSSAKEDLQRSHYGSLVENPFNDRPVSIANSITTATTSVYQKRDSIESSTSHQHTTTVATQITRAKPQIMRVNTVKVQDGLHRQGSIKKTLVTDDNPFDDKHKLTDSVVSAPGDGEITIFWNGT